MKLKIHVTFVLLCILLVGLVRAELRVWTDEAGMIIEAEHVRTR